MIFFLMTFTLNEIILPVLRIHPVGMSWGSPQPSACLNFSLSPDSQFVPISLSFGEERGQHMHFVLSVLGGPKKSLVAKWSTLSLMFFLRNPWDPPMPTLLVIGSWHFDIISPPEYIINPKQFLNCIIGLKGMKMLGGVFTNDWMGGVYCLI